MEGPPFPHSNQLNGQLTYLHNDLEKRLYPIDAKKPFLPGQPRIELANPALFDYLSTDLLVPYLDKAASWLWLVGTPCNSHISPLHHQAVRGRTIILTENPHLHLIWHYNVIFIKAMPQYLLSFAFWRYVNTQPPAIKQAALGFMRTYSWLVRYESDFAIAIEKGLIPKIKEGIGGDFEAKPITYEDFCRLISSFENLEDDLVSPRYQYGELRLTRLNFYSRILLKQWTYHHIEAQWATFLGSFIAPFAIIFGLLTITLNAIQVELSAIQVELDAIQVATEHGAVGSVHKPWIDFAIFSKKYPIAILSFVVSVVVLILSVIVIMFVHDQYFALRIIKEKRSNSRNPAWKTRRSGVV